MDRKAFISALISGILLGVAYNLLWGWLAFVALVPLFWGIRFQSLRTAYLLGLITTGVSYCVSLSWVDTALHIYGGMASIWSILAVVLLGIFLAIWSAIALPSGLWLHRRTQVPLYLIWPALWTVLDWGRTVWFPFGGFPWSHLGMPLAFYPWVIQIADLFGIFGVIFLVALINAVFAESIFLLQGSQTLSKVKKMWALSGAITVLMGIVLVYGAVRTKQWDQPTPMQPRLRVALIQGNIEQDVKMQTENRGEQLRVYQEAASKVQEGVDLVVWPESAWPYAMSLNLKRMDPKEFGWKPTKNSYPYSLIGTQFSLGEDYYNGAALFDAQGNVQGTYQKTKLVPFGEYVPFQSLFSFLSPVAFREGFVAGNGLKPIPMEWVPVGTLICYEDIFPQLSRRLVNEDAQVLVNLTNDAWYGVSSAPLQHLALSVFRAVETRRFLLRSTNTGITAVVDATGRVLARAPLFERSTLMFRVPLLSAKTLYVLWGDVWVWVCMLFLLSVIGVSFRRKPESRHMI